MTCYTTKGEHKVEQNNGSFYHLCLSVLSENSQWEVIKLVFINAENKDVLLEGKCAKRYMAYYCCQVCITTIKIGESNAFLKLRMWKERPETTFEWSCTYIYQYTKNV